MLDSVVCAQLIRQHTGAQQSLYAQQKKSALALWQQHAIAIKTYEVSPASDAYSVCAVDGSQIYPDRHEGFSEYLLNIGTARFVYGADSCAYLRNFPLIFSGMRDGALLEAADVDAQREALELRTATEIAQQFPEALILFDGPLAGQLPRAAGYISASNSRQLVELFEKKVNQKFEYLVDTDIVEFFLQPGYYTQRVYGQSFYLHVGAEIARVEIAASARDTMPLIAALLYDQALKGGGYPVALAEAHEQAVVKAPDREFFYALLREQYGYQVGTSRKLAQKQAPMV